MVSVNYAYEKDVNSMKKLLVLLLLFTGCEKTYISPVSITGTTVAVTNNAKTSGGTGTVVKASLGESQILTNAHVCEVVKNGGLVTSTLNIQGSVASYQVSELHDLCLITVYKNFILSATLSSTEPEFHENATISGHPQLYPNIVTTGHFSENRIIEVVYGYKDCSEAEKQDPKTALLCMLVGKLPLVKSYESTLVSATIMPGSSGSGIFTSNGQLGAVVFAGSGQLSYALAVPYGYVKNFLENETKHLERKIPNNIIEFADLLSDNKRIRQQFIDVCRNDPSLFNNPLCAYVSGATTILRK